MICPKCGSAKMSKTLSKGVQFRCAQCGYEGPAMGGLG